MDGLLYTVDSKNGNVPVVQLWLTARMEMYQFLKRSKARVKGTEYK